MKALITIGCIALLLVGCVKNDYEDFKLYEDPYEARVPVDLDVVWNGSQSTTITWKVDLDYLEEFHPDSQVKLSVGPYTIAYLEGEEGSFNYSLPGGFNQYSSVHLEILRDGETIFESIHPIQW